MGQHVTSLPKDPSGTGAFVDWCKKVGRCILERSIIPGPGIKASYTARGVVVEATAKPAEAEPPVPIQWRGEWSAALTYEQDDIVIRGSKNLSSADHNDSDNILLNGGKAGVFIALKAVPAGIAPIEPNTNAAGYWETLARFSTHIFVVAVGPTAGDTSTTSKIIMNAKTPNGSIVMNLADCNGKNLTVREVGVCVDGIARHMMVIGSAPY